jgi:hypothetical protein
MAFRANKDGTWVGGNDQSEGTVVYGKSGDNWLYAKEVFANRAGTWYRAWTDCRKYDASGRGWSDPVSVVTYSGTCGNRTQTTTVTRTKTGCPDDVRPTTISSPNCDAGCFDASSSTENIYSGTCASRTYVVRTTITYTAKAGSNCTTYSTSSDGSPIASPTCDGACTTAKTGDFSQGGISYTYTGTPGSYYAFPNPTCSSGCDFSSAYYSVTTCNGTNTITLTDAGTCYNVFGDPC